MIKPKGGIPRQENQMSTTTENNENTGTVVDIKHALRNALNLIKSNEGELQYLNASCELTKAVEKETGVFNKLHELHSHEAIMLAAESFMKLGKTVAEYKAEYDHVVQVKARVLRNPQPETVDALSHEADLRYRQLELATYVAETLRLSFKEVELHRFTAWQNEQKSKKS
jgi:hypothetical protein